jgi:hypothetical protein
MAKPTPLFLSKLMAGLKREYALLWAAETGDPNLLLHACLMTGAEMQVFELDRTIRR